MKRLAHALLLLFPNDVLAQRVPPIVSTLDAHYISLAEALIEKTRREKPAVARAADELQLQLPRIISELEQKARSDQPKGSFASADSPEEAVAALEIQVARRGTQIDTELRFALGRLKTAQGALRPISSLVEQRERKQQLISEVISLIGNLLSGKPLQPQPSDSSSGENKADRAGPVASEALKEDSSTRADTALSLEP
jgi:hypothetical protein